MTLWIQWFTKFLWGWPQWPQIPFDSDCHHKLQSRQPTWYKTYIFKEISLLCPCDVTTGIYILGPLVTPNGLFLPLISLEFLLVLNMIHPHTTSHMNSQSEKLHLKQFTGKISQAHIPIVHNIHTNSITLHFLLIKTKNWWPSPLFFYYQHISQLFLKLQTILSKNCQLKVSFLLS